MINELVKDAYDIASKHGFWDPPYIENDLAIPTKLWLAAGELVEAGNVHHKQDLNVDENMDKFIEEIADVFIRLFDLVGYVNTHYPSIVNLEATILRKMAINKMRPHKHGKNY